MVRNNLARPRAIFGIWMACHDKLTLATKERFHRFGIVENDKCCFCEQQQTLQNLLFDCSNMRSIWLKVLEWLHIKHIPGGWHK